ncbi:MAG: Holliday junction DNA helicase RuvA [Gemmatimonadetes bacterium RBG_16_66_8]|nr:MAG: Holliday junction DNA helicase RuvA [Gemmatimonadetes bacterium RBG_16_66_8]
MIGAVRGRIAGRTADRVLVATPGGVTYEIAVPLGVLERLPGDVREIELTTVLVVREDGWALFGFDDPTERVVFQRLLSATGVGPRLALAMLSALGGGSRVIRAIRDNDLATLCTVPGVGRKTAERVVVELKDKVADLARSEAAASARAPAADQAVQALVGLGYPALEAERAVRTVVSQDGAGDPVDVIRRSLQLLTGAR